MNGASRSASSTYANTSRSRRSPRPYADSSRSFDKVYTREDLADQERHRASFVQRHKRTDHTRSPYARQPAPPPPSRRPFFVDLTTDDGVDSFLESFISEDRLGNSEASRGSWLHYKRIEEKNIRKCRERRRLKEDLVNVPILIKPRSESAFNSRLSYHGPVEEHGQCPPYSTPDPTPEANKNDENYIKYVHPIILRSQLNNLKNLQPRDWTIPGSCRANPIYVD